MKIGIIGLGLIGGSLAKALSKNEIIAFDKNEEYLKEALEEGVIAKYTLEINEEFSKVDMIFVCTPVKYVYEYVEAVSKYIKEDCIVTDVGSTKHEIVTRVEESFPDMNFVGAHPMAGSEKIGYSNRIENLFEGKYYLIVRTANTKESNIQKVYKVIKNLKSIPIVIDLKDHDSAVSVISHIPHVVASGLVKLVQVAESEEQMQTLAGGGFKDITRIASSSPEMWQNICMQNKEEILKGIQKFRDILNVFEQDLSNNEEEKIFKYFEEAKQYRDNILRR